MAALRRKPRTRRLSQIWQELGIPADYALVRHLPRQREAKRLTPIGRNPDGRVVRLAPRPAAAWRRLHFAAAANGIVLLPVSGFRSRARQVRIIRGKLRTGQLIADILRLVAAPGCSEHHTGCALDIGAPEVHGLDIRFARTPAFRWMKKHAGRFGFRLSYPRKNRHGIGYEPWHWRWTAARTF